MDPNPVRPPWWHLKNVRGSLGVRDGSIRLHCDAFSVLFQPNFRQTVTVQFKLRENIFLKNVGNIVFGIKCEKICTSNAIMIV